MSAFNANAIQFRIRTGNDDLRSDSKATADILTPDGNIQFTVVLKDNNTPGWDNWSFHTVLSTLNPLLTTISGVRINLLQGVPSDPFQTGDNWDIASLNVNLVNIASDGTILNQACQIDLTGNSVLQDGSIGLVRLSGLADSSGAGPTSPNYLTGDDSGCPPGS